jgi:hypothetical protein
MSYFDFGKTRLYALLAALGLMAGGAYSTIRWFMAGALPGKWVGLPEFESATQRLQIESQMWGSLALVSPLLAALLLGLYARDITSFAKPIQSNIPKGYLGRLALSALGTLGFILFLIFVSFVLYKLGVTTN